MPFPTFINTESLNKVAKTTKDKSLKKKTVQDFTTAHLVQVQLSIQIVQKLKISSDGKHMTLELCQENSQC